MQNLIRSVALLAVLGSRVSIAQTIGSARSPIGQTVSSMHAPDVRSIGRAPIGHRQPSTSDVPLENADDIERLSPEDAAVDRALIICRGC